MYFPWYSSFVLLLEKIECIFSIVPLNLNVLGNFTFPSLTYANVHGPASIHACTHVYNPSWMYAWVLACTRVASIWVNFSMNDLKFANRIVYRYVHVHGFFYNICALHIQRKFKYYIIVTMRNNYISNIHWKNVHFTIDQYFYVKTVFIIDVLTSLSFT